MINQASDCILLDKETRAEAGSLLPQKAVPWAQLKHLVQQLQAVQPDEPGLQLHTVCKGSQLVLQPPQARQKSPELQARLAKLQAALEQQHYDRMVHDVTEKERAAATAAEGLFRSFKDQLSFGIHVLVMMGTFYALGHVAGRGLSLKTSVHAACGLVGLVLALLLESVLLIIRTSHPPSLEKYRHLQDGYRAPPAPATQQQQPPSGLQKKRQ